MDTKQTQATRQWNLVRLLSESPEGLPLKTLAERLDITPRTVNRDLATLQQAGVPLVETLKAHGLKHWKLSEKIHGMPSTFTYDEAAAMYPGRRFLEPLTRTFLWDAADSALRKIRSQLGSQAIRHLDRLLNIFRLGKHSAEKAEKADLIDALILGCEECREVVITYHSLSSDADETYAIRPYELELFGDTVYIGGFSCKSNGLRVWKLNRMCSALVTDVKFEKPGDFEMPSFASPSDPLQKVRIRFDSRVARFVQEHRWHESEKITEQADGSLIVEYELRDTVLLKNRLLSYGRHAEVLGPESMRNEIRDEIESMRKRYDI